MSALGLDDRRRKVHKLLPLENGCGLEIAPNWAPVVTKSEGDVLYCDYLTYEQLLEREKTNPGRIQHGLRVQRLDFIWEIGKSLQECAGTAAPFDYVVSCHVFEHVPNFLEYLYQVRAVTKDDGVIAMVLPDAKGSGEYFRRETNAAELIDSYLLGQTVPSPGQVYDGLKNLFDFQNVPLEGRTLSDVKRLFTDIDSYNAALRASQEYVDVHCWAFSRDGFAEVAGELRAIGLFDFEIESLESSPATETGHGSEFYVKLRPTAPPRPSRLRARSQLAFGTQPGADGEPGLSDIDRVRIHGEKAFQEAVAVQDALKVEKEALEAAMARAVAHGEKAFREAVAAQDMLKAEKSLAENRLARLEATSLVKLGRRLGLLPR